MAMDGASPASVAPAADADHGNGIGNAVATAEKTWTTADEQQPSSSSEADAKSGLVTTATSTESSSSSEHETTAAAAAESNANTTNLKRRRPTVTAKSNQPRGKLRVSLLHSDKYIAILSDAMGHIHQDRDRLLSSLLMCCGFLRQTPSFFTVVEPKRASRSHLERFHCPAYLDLLEYVLPEAARQQQEGGGGGGSGNGLVHDGNDPSSLTNAPRSKDFHDVLDSYGLTEDCHLPEDPEGRALLWRYCQYVAGASMQGAHLLLTDRTDVAINWGGGRHHAHTDRAGGFCFVNDAVLAIQHLIGGSDGANGETTLAEKRRVLYLDVDIHHADGVQHAFYDTDQVLTVSFHRRAPGFFPPSSGDSSEKGRSGTDGVGFALNLPLPKQCTDEEFIAMFTLSIDKLLPAYDPHHVVLCVGADGVKGDPIVGVEGWNLSPEGIAECVRLTAERCGALYRTNSSSATKPRKLLVLGAGGYHPTNAARSFLLSTAAACEGARPGMLWNELPKDVPQHEYFGRYGPEFHLISPDFCAFGADGKETCQADNAGMTRTAVVEHKGDEERMKEFEAAKKSINMCCLFVQNKRESIMSMPFNSKADHEIKDAEEDWAIGPNKQRKVSLSRGGKRRKKNRKNGARSDTKTTSIAAIVEGEENC